MAVDDVVFHRGSLQPARVADARLRRVPPAAHVGDYLTAYEHRYRIPVERPVTVERVGYADGIYRSRAGKKTWTAKNVVPATGTWSAPFIV